MNNKSFNTNKSLDQVCKEIEEMIPCVLGTKPNKTKEEKSFIYYPARRFMGTDDNMDDVYIIVRKVNNSITHIKLCNEQYHDKNWRTPSLERAFNKLSNVLEQMFK